MILNFQLSKDPINILINIQGSQNRNYIINIMEQENEHFLIVHDCPDFKKGYNFCKHIVKALLILDKEVCQKVCANRYRISFSSRTSEITKTKQQSFENKATKLTEQRKYLKAINYYEKAFLESNDKKYTSKIVEIAISEKISHIAIKYLAKFEDLRKSNKEKLVELINSILQNKKMLPFSEYVDSLCNINVILSNLPLEFLKSKINQIAFQEVENPLDMFIILFNLHTKGSINFLMYFNEIMNTDFHKYEDLKVYMENQLFKSLENALFNLESEEVINTYVELIKRCSFKIRNDLRIKLEDYSNNVKKLYREALHRKHAALRNLVISNLKTDRLHPLSFTYKYRFPSLLWTNAKKDRSNLYYFILKKCGLDRENLNYLNITDFVENYPVFKSLFDANNPQPEAVKNFWNDDDYTIKNKVVLNRKKAPKYNINLANIESYILIEWDIAQKPILGSYICQFSEGFLIPEKNNPLTHEIQPFDIILCYNKPIEIKIDNIQIYRPVRRVNLQNAIKLVYQGINYISSYIPLHLVEDLRKHEIDEVEAINRMHEAFKIMFFPKKEEFVKLFNRFIKNKVSDEYNQFYLSLLDNSNYKEKVLKILGFERFQLIFKDKSMLSGFREKSLKRNSLYELRYELKKYISRKLIGIIKSKRFGELDILQLRKFPEFRQYTIRIIHEKKKRLLKCKIVDVGNNLLDVSELANDIYGKVILEEANVKKIESSELKAQNQYLIQTEEARKIFENFRYLNLDTPQIITKKI